MLNNCFIKFSSKFQRLSYNYKFYLMIYNILILLAANIFIPLVPIFPQIFIGYNIYEYTYRQTTVYDDMNLTRIYQNQQFKRAFRDSMKRLHPDRGGSQQNFDRVKGIKSIMQNPNHYYDLYNITNIDLSFNQPLKDVVSMKQLFHQFEMYLFYFVAMLYILAFTIDQDLKPSRYFLIPLTFAFGAYEYYIYQNPKQLTIIDILINDKTPIFIQSMLLKQLFCILSAIIRTRYLRRKTKESEILDEFNKLPLLNYNCLYNNQKSNLKKQENSEQAKLLKQNEKSEQQYISVLAKTLTFYNLKLKKHQEAKVSWSTRIRNWISKGFSLLIFGVMIYNLALSDSSEKGDSYSQQY